MRSINVLVTYLLTANLESLGHSFNTIRLQPVVHDT